jgi:hypothetical protein
MGETEGKRQNGALREEET